MRKPLADYYTAYVRKDGSKLLMKHCKECNKAKTKEYRQAKLDQYRDKARVKAAQYRTDNPNYDRDMKIRRKYGLTRERWEEMLDEQNGGCPICQRDLATLKVCVDHDHATGTVRGLLCDVCNVGLGMFKDDPDHLRRARDYLLHSAAP